MLTDIVHLLFRLLFEEYHPEKLKFSAAKYQKKIEGMEWKTFHINLKEGTYGTCVDLRKIHNKSVSWLFQVAVDLYLERAVEILKKKADRYGSIYINLLKISDTTHSFGIFHDIPPAEILDYFLSNEET
jgi:hypothetical protein